jgi:hypothetical protein
LAVTGSRAASTGATTAPGRLGVLNGRDVLDQRRSRADEVTEHRVTGADARDGRLDACGACQRLDVADLLRRHQRDDHTFGTCTGGAT